MRWRSLAVLVGLAACGGGQGAGRDAAVDGAGDHGWTMPGPETLVDPARYDCRSAATPPARTSTLPLGCFRDRACDGLVVVAHRGGTYFAPENTLGAIRSAITIGADMVELDTQVTSDGEVVLMHDGDVDRTTEGSGQVDSFSLAEIQGLPLVIRDDLPAGADFACERVPTFRDALALCRGRIDIMVDLKSGAAAAALVVEEEGMLDQAILIGSQSELTEARAAVPDVRLMIRPEQFSEVQPFFEAFDPPPDVVHIDPGFDDQTTVDLVHGFPAKILINMWVADANAVLLGEVDAYAEAHVVGMDLQQSEWAFFALASVGRCHCHFP